MCSPAIRANTEGWDEAHENAEIACGVCNGTEHVRLGTVPVEPSGCVRPVFSWEFWKLCQDCHTNGWDPPTSAIASLTGERVTYRNSRTQISITR